MWKSAADKKWDGNFTWIIALYIMRYFDGRVAVKEIMLHLKFII